MFSNWGITFVDFNTSFSDLSTRLNLMFEKLKQVILKAVQIIVLQSYSNKALKAYSVSVILSIFIS